jgi:glucosamine--fructose-6-phosphate aminotransferase (isomerizing)
LPDFEGVEMTTYLENLHGQPEALRGVARAYASPAGSALLDQAAAALRKRALTSTGMGASLFALLATRPSFDAAASPHWIEETGYLSEQSWPSSRSLDGLLVVSQSGETIEARTLAKQVTADATVLVTRDPESSLAASADVVLPLYCEPDLSVALKTYTSTTAVLALLAARIQAVDPQPVFDEINACADQMEALIGAIGDEAAAAARHLGAATKIYAVGRGRSLGSALGTGLLFKEASKRHAEGQSSAQFRHGAVEVVDDQTAAVVFASSEPGKRQLDENLVSELLDYGARVVVICDRDYPNVPQEAVTLRIPTAPELSRVILEIVPPQLMAYHAAELNGVTAGEFRNTVPVIVTA